MVLDDRHHLLQLLDVVLHIPDTTRIIAPTTRGGLPQELEPLLLGPVGHDDRAVPDAVPDPAESLAWCARPRTPFPVSEPERRAPTRTRWAASGVWTVVACAGHAGAGLVRDVQDRVCGRLIRGIQDRFWC